MSRAGMRTVNVGGIVAPSAEIKNNPAAIRRISMRSNLSLNAPATIATRIQPTSAELPNHPPYNLLSRN